MHGRSYNRRNQKNKFVILSDRSEAQEVEGPAFRGAKFIK
jgi:hypothetical protein